MPVLTERRCKCLTVNISFDRVTLAKLEVAYPVVRQLINLKEIFLKKGASENWLSILSVNEVGKRDIS